MPTVLKAWLFVTPPLFLMFFVVNKITHFSHPVRSALIEASVLGVGIIVLSAASKLKWM